MKHSNLDAFLFARFKCQMDTDRNHDKFYKHCEKNNVSALENSKTSFPKRLEWKHIADVWWPPICFSRSLLDTFHWFCIGIEIIKIFYFKWFSIVLYYIDLNGKRQTLETKQIKRHGVLLHFSDIKLWLQFVLLLILTTFMIHVR